MILNLLGMCSKWSLLPNMFITIIEHVDADIEVWLQMKIEVLWLNWCFFQTGFTSLHLACLKGHADIVPLLSKKRADVNQQVTEVLWFVKYGCTWICLLLYFLIWAYWRFKNNCFSRHTCTCPVLICHELNKYSLIDCIASIMYMYLKQSCIKVIVKCYCYYSYLHSK